MDKASLKRAYKETPRAMGVFKITCAGSEKVYIGSGVNLLGRINRHKAELRLGGHRNKGLQEAWKTHGEEAFTFEVIDELDQKIDRKADPAEELHLLLEMWTGKLGAEGLTVTIL